MIDFSSIDVTQVLIGLGSLFGSALGAYTVVRRKTKPFRDTIGSVEILRGEIQNPINGEKTLRADIQNILLNVDNLHEDVKGMRLDMRGMGERLHLVERDVISIIRRKLTGKETA